MKRPTSRALTKPPGNSSPMAGVPIADTIGRLSDTVAAVAGVFTEVQKTKQVIATTQMEIVKAVKATQNAQIHANVRFKELETDDARHQREHTLAMAELQLRAQQQADEREVRQRRVEKQIAEGQDRLAPPRSHQE